MSWAALALTVSLAGAPLNLGPLGRGEPLGPSITWAEDAEGTWTWDQAWKKSTSFAALRSARFSRGYTHSVYWLRLDWTRPAGDLRDLYLMTWTVHVSRVDAMFHSEQDQDSVPLRLGDEEKFDPRTPRTWLPSLKFPLGSGSLLIRLESTNAILFDPRIYDSAALWSTLELCHTGVGFLLGFLVLMALFNLFMVATVRDSLYLWYTAYLANLVAYLALYTGFLQSLVPEQKPFQSAWELPVEASLLVIAWCFAYRANRFGDWRWAPWLTGIFAALAGVALILQATGQHQWGLRLINASLVLMTLTAEAGLIVQAVRGHRFSRFFAAGWASLLVAGVAILLDTAVQVDFANDTVLSSVLLFFGVLVETTLLSAALADRVRLLQKELDHQLVEASRTERLSTLGLLTARVGHEINTPNHVIALNANLLETLHHRVVDDRTRAREEGTDPTPQIDRWLAESRPLVRSIRQASGQINLVVATLGAVRSRVKKGPVDLAALLRQTLELYELRWRESTSRFVLRLPEHELPIEGVDFRLQELVVNLVANALQALPSRDKGVIVSAEAVGEELLLSVTDEGVGMSPEVLASLGTPFFSTKLDQGGSGLGWGLCQEIVKDHQGRLEVLSQPGKGTTIRVWFPRQG